KEHGSDLDVDDAPDRDPADQDEDEPCGEQDTAAAVVEQGIEIRGIRNRDDRDEGDGKDGDGQSSQTPLSRERLHQSPEVEALPDRLRHAVENLSCVAAGLPLEHRDEADVLELLAAHAVSDSRARLVE